MLGAAQLAMLIMPVLLTNTLHNTVPAIYIQHAAYNVGVSEWHKVDVEKALVMHTMGANALDSISQDSCKYDTRTRCL